MRAWRVREPAPIGRGPLEFGSVEVPAPGAGEVLIAVRACGVCRTDLHIAEGDLPVHRPLVIPGHEVVGEVVALGEVKNGASEPVFTSMSCPTIEKVTVAMPLG